MALTSTMFNVSVDLSDVDRAVYESFEVKVAQHPSESSDYMLTRILAYCLEYADGIAFSAGGVSSPDEPPLAIRDLTGRLVVWIDVGLPDAERLHRASKLADRVVVYTHRDRRQLVAQLEGKKIFGREKLELYAFSRELVTAAAAKLERRTKISLSVTERHLYLDINGTGLEGEVEPISL